MSQYIQPSFAFVTPGELMAAAIALTSCPGYTQHVMGYPTPLPQGADPHAAYKYYIQAYREEAKVK